jgi:hypothetical protein
MFFEAGTERGRDIRAEVELASSTSPRAAMRGPALLTRLPSTSPQVPPSPVRV